MRPLRADHRAAVAGHWCGHRWPGRELDARVDARHVVVLLTDVSLHGHKYAIKAVLGATGIAAPGPATVLTSDSEVLTALCGGRPP